MSVGSPPCQATVTSGSAWASSSWRTYASSTSSDMRNRSPGYSASFSKKKQYWQSRLQMGPLGLARTWKFAGAVGGRWAGIAGTTDSDGCAVSCRPVRMKVTGASVAMADVTPMHIGSAFQSNGEQGTQVTHVGGGFSTNTNGPGPRGRRTIWIVPISSSDPVESHPNRLTCLAGARHRDLRPCSPQVLSHTVCGEERCSVALGRP